MCATGIDLAGCMKNDCAILYSEFKTLCVLNSTSFSSLNISESDLPTSRWILGMDIVELDVSFHTKYLLLNKRIQQSRIKWMEIVEKEKQ